MGLKSIEGEGYSLSQNNAGLRLLCCINQCIVATAQNESQIAFSSHRARARAFLRSVSRATASFELRSKSFACVNRSVLS